MCNDTVMLAGTDLSPRGIGYCHGAQGWPSNNPYVHEPEARDYELGFNAGKSAYYNMQYLKGAPRHDHT